jgi:hypothetical protein
LNFQPLLPELPGIVVLEQSRKLILAA